MSKSASNVRIDLLKERIENLEEVLRDVIAASAREFGTEYAGQLIDRVNNPK